MTLRRDYSAITDRIAALSNRADTEVSVVGSVEELPVHRLVRQSSSTVTRRLLLTSGVHGDEPAGIEAVLNFLETAPTPDGFEFVVVPCVNPTGYVRGTRENKGGVDINRSFEADDAEEVLIIKGLLGAQRFDCHVDFHEDWEATGFYMYETCAGGGGVGSTIIERVEAIMPIDSDGEESDDSEPVSRGVLCVNPSWGRQGLLTYVLAFHTSHAVMFETPSATPMAMRVAAHTIAFNTVLDYLS